MQFLVLILKDVMVWLDLGIEELDWLLVYVVCEFYVGQYLCRRDGKQKMIFLQEFSSCYFQPEKEDWPGKRRKELSPLSQTDAVSLALSIYIFISLVNVLEDFFLDI